MLYSLISFATEPFRITSIKPYLYNRDGVCESYLIRAKRNDSIFQIYPPVSEEAKGEKIKKWRKYNIEVERVNISYHSDTIAGRYVMPFCSPSYFGLTEEERFHNAVYRAVNTNGAYIRK